MGVAHFLRDLRLRPDWLPELGGVGVDCIDPSGLFTADIVPGSRERERHVPVCMYLHCDCTASWGPCTIDNIVKLTPQRYTQSTPLFQELSPFYTVSNRQTQMVSS